MNRIKKCKRCGNIFNTTSKYAEICPSCKSFKSGSGIGRISYLGLFIKELDKHGKQNKKRN